MKHIVSTLFSWSFLLLLCTFQAQAQLTAIPDPNFEAHLISEGIDQDQTLNGRMATADAVNVVTLRLSHKSISDLTGIKAFVNLQNLYCGHNNLQSLDVSGLPKLDRIDVSHNNLQSVNLSNCPLLKYVYLQSNPGLSMVDLSTNPSLLALFASHTNLQSLDLTNNPLVNAINISVTHVPRTDFTNLTNLYSLAVDNLNWGSIDVSIYPNLANLWVRGNNLNVLDVNSNPNLESLYCSRNNLRQLNLQNNSLLQSFSCDRNDLPALDLSNNLLLKDIHASDNKIRQIDLSNLAMLEILSFSNNELAVLDLSNNQYLRFVDVKGNLLYYINGKNDGMLGQNTPGIARVDFSNNMSNLLVCLKDTSIYRHPLIWKDDATTTYSEVCPNSNLLGHVRLDTNLNCYPEINELGLRGYSIIATSAVDTSYLWTTSQGQYVGELPHGTYQLNFVENMLPYRAACSIQQSTTLDSITPRDTIDWSIFTTVECPYMEVSISAPFIRAAGGGSAYTVNYCNKGTADAHGVYVEVTIDSALQVLSTSIPIQSQVGNVYTFNIDTVLINNCGRFQIQVLLNSGLDISNVYCSEAHIFPDSLCENTWSGPIIETTSNCQQDTVFFELHNVGAAMGVAQTYTIFEDHVMLMTAPFTLGANGNMIIAQAASPNKTYRIEATQAAGIPPYVASPIAYSSTFSCNNNLPLNWNNQFLNQFYTGNSTPWVHRDCQQAIAPYDPNDKAAQPAGYGANHYIYNTTPLDYKVRFQNIGSDTAFNVVIVDTISPFLDITTLKVGASSHPYTWTITNNRVLRMTFADIKLVDSTTNEPLSHGFFTYTIQQKPNLPLGTRIENTAAIYFDYNPPIFTNTTFHTIGQKFYSTGFNHTDEVWSEAPSIKVYPNPFQEYTTLQVEGVEQWQELTLEVIDITGRVVQQLTSKHTNQILLSRKHLVQGLYFYRLLGNGQLIGTGKLQVQ